MQKYGQRGPRMPQNAPQLGLFDQQEKEKVKSQTAYSSRHKRGAKLDERKVEVDTSSN